MNGLSQRGAEYAVDRQTYNPLQYQPPVTPQYPVNLYPAVGAPRSTGGAPVMTKPVASIELEQLEYMGNSQSGGDSSLSASLLSSSAHAEKEPECRKVYLNLPNQAQRFCSNEVITAKYNVFTFLPKNLWQQFTRVANQYFLVISALQMLTPFSPTSRFTTFGPLCVVVILSMVKELYEDTKRHRQDNETNSKPCIIGRGAMMTESQWRDVKVGDILQVTSRGLSSRAGLHACCILHIACCRPAGD